MTLRGTITSPLLPTWRRFNELFVGKSNLSILRRLEYEVLEGLQYSGRILDFGGGEKAKYQDRLRNWTLNCSVESANIDPAIHPTILIIPEHPLPIENNVYDKVLTFNTLEHVYNVREILVELLRILKHGGELIVTVPFLFRIHGHPDDFFRGTPSWWERTLTELGFVDIKIQPLVWGPMSTGLSVTGVPGPFKKMRMIAALLLDLVYAKWTIQNRLSSALTVSEPCAMSPLGFLIKAKKPW
jgi:SAM-dependent methyltransferase